MVLPVQAVAPKVEEEEPSHDPVLQRLAKSDTFDSDWPTLRHHLHLALLSTLPIFQARAPPAPYQFPADSPARPSNPTAASPTPSPLGGTKPSSPFASTSTVPPSSSLLLSRTSFSKASLPADEQPSTIGGLVIPPFPPLDPERRANRRLSAATIGPVPPAVAARMNGHQAGGAGSLTRGNVYEDDWDEAVVIGGKKLPGWMEEEEGKKEVERVGKLIDDLEEPPFTIQRLAELLLNPTKHHSTLGKFLRALEKNLLVTTSWSAPSYVAVPPSTFSGSRGLFGPTSSPSPASSSSASAPDSNSTMPIGSTTPMFSPIPFLVRPPMDSDSTMDVDQDVSVGNASSAKEASEELMSPLVLNEKELEAEISGEGKQVTASDEPGRSTPSASSSGRSQTPEPEELSSRPQPIQQSPPQTSPNTTAHVLQSQPSPNSTLSSSESIDPAHQPYLGRVDELDTGPIISQSDSASASASGSASTGGHTNGVDEGMGTGEGGNMTPHGMSDRPIPLSATTTVAASEEGERKVAGLPRTKSVLSLSERFVGQEEQEEESEVVDEDVKLEAKKARVEDEVKEGIEETAKEEDIKGEGSAGMEVDQTSEERVEGTKNVEGE